MLSILIPIHNFDIRPLVHKLHKECMALGVNFEIICLDDASDISFRKLNDELSTIENVSYVLLPHNLGRSAIRNRLAEMAKYDFLLFMDCDTMPEKADFIDIYVRNLKQGTVLYGGRSYQPEKPTDPELYFHWFYGSNREVSSLTKRTEAPHRSFMTNNFVIPKDILLKIRFDESLKQYGHEDTVFGLELKKLEIPILHLDNPMRHNGLEKAGDFLRKSEQAIDNLLILMKKHELAADIKLLRYFLKTQKWGLHLFIKLWFRMNKVRLRKNLLGKNPSLRSFDLYKLGYMVELAMMR